MTRRILDTLSVSLLMKGEAVAVEHLSGCKPGSISIPQPVVAEIAFGLARMVESKRKRNLETRFQALLHNLQREPWTDQVSLMFGKTKALLEARGEPLEDFDVAIAAHALARQGILVSDNIRHLGRIPGLVLESWG